MAVIKAHVDHVWTAVQLKLQLESTDVAVFALENDEIIASRGDLTPTEGVVVDGALRISVVTKKREEKHLVQAEDLRDQLRALQCRNQV